MTNAIEMQNISMIFGSFVANNKINFVVKKNEIHALIGENGAGKSTLMSILFGLYQPSSGTIKINQQLVKIKNPIEANNLGIGMVHQHFKLVDTFSIFDNITLNREKTTWGFITKKESLKKINQIMDKYQFWLDLKKKINQTSVFEQQRTEILKMLYQDAEILIFDEPTAVLTPQQIDEFLKALLYLKKMGKTIVIISHKLDELRKVADRGTILRRGKVVETFDMQAVDNQKIAQLMVGSKIVLPINDHRQTFKKPLLKVENLFVRKHDYHRLVGLKDFSFTVNHGEIVAICGIEGNGQIELINAITGLQKVDQGKIWLHNEQKSQENNQPLFEDITNFSIKDRYKIGIGHIPTDRHKYGLVLDMNVWENIVVQDFYQNKFSNWGFFKFNDIKEYAKNVVNHFDIRTPHGINSIVRYMSGGNQQKLIVGREISKDWVNLLIVAQPTRGLDVGAIKNIHTYLLSTRDQNKGVLLISYELDEIIALADRIIVINSGHKIKELNSQDVSRNKLGELMTQTKVNKVHKNG